MTVTLTPHAEALLQQLLGGGSPEQVIERALELLAEKKTPRRSVGGPTRHDEALRWLSENRRAYAGQWVALAGSTLLAASKDARDVYARVLDERPPALMVKVDAQDMPFAGW
jgi:hypothetical protein